MSGRRMALILVLALIAGVAVWAGWLMARDESQAAVAPATVDVTALTPAEHARLVERGRYVARAANCESCHKTEAGAPYAGGLRLDTPLGAIYGTNITPSRTDGIGAYSLDDFYRSLVLGITPGGRRLFPAMPYTSYHAFARADSDALYTYLMSLPAIDKPNRPPELTFPFSYRPLIAFWNLLYRPEPAEPMAVAERSSEWNRGRYLVETLGHCGECHTPRNFAFAMQRDRSLQGFVLEGALAPNMTTAELKRNGWNTDDLVAYMGSGLSPQGAPDFRMYQVLDTSTRYLTAGDLEAMATYLLDNPSTGAGATDARGPATDGPTDTSTDTSKGRSLYMGLCAGCHGDEHFDRPGVAVPMRTNTTARHDNPLNFIRIVREGIAARDLPGDTRRQRMPAYPALTDQEIAEMLNYIRATWGGAPATVSPSDVAEASLNRPSR